MLVDKIDDIKGVSKNVIKQFKQFALVCKNVGGKVEIDDISGFAGVNCRIKNKRVRFGYDKILDRFNFSIRRGVYVVSDISSPKQLETTGSNIIRLKSPASVHIDIEELLKSKD